MDTQRQPIAPAAPVADSVQHGHSGMDRIERQIDAIWSAITSEETATAADGAIVSRGIAYDAGILADRSHGAADRLEQIRHRLMSPNVASIRPPEPAKFNPFGNQHVAR